ncbi:hypothetical protein ES705_11285 [subsurface metagenome]
MKIIRLMLYSGYKKALFLKKKALSSVIFNPYQDFFSKKFLILEL